MAADILTNEQKRAVEDALNKAIPELEREIGRAKMAKIDVTTLEAQLVELKTRLRAIHDVYVRKSTSGV